MQQPVPPVWQQRLALFFRQQAVRNLGLSLAIGVAGVGILALAQPAYMRAMGRLLPNGDGALHAFWVLASAARKWRAFALGSMFDGNQYFPFGQVAAFTEAMPLPGLLMAALMGTGASGQIAYGVLVLLSCGLTFGAAAWTALRLGAGPWSAALGAGLLGFTQFGWVHAGNLALTSLWALPLLLGPIVRFWQTGERRLTWEFAAMGLLLALVSRQLFVIALPIALAGLWLWGHRSARDRELLKPTGIAFGAGVLILAMIYRPYVRSAALYGEQITPALHLLGSEKWSSLYRPGSGLALLKSLAVAPPGPNAGSAFLSPVQALVILALPVVLIGAALIRNLPGRRRLMTISGGLLAGSIWFAFAAMGPRAEGEMFGFNVWRVTSWLPGMSGLTAPAHTFVLVLLLVAAAAVWLSEAGAQIIPKARQHIPYVMGGLLLIHIVSVWPTPSWRWRLPEEVPLEEVEAAMRGDSKGAIAVVPAALHSGLEQLIAARTGHPVLGGGGHFAPLATSEWLVPALEHCDSHACIETLQNNGFRFLAVEVGALSKESRGFLGRSFFLKRLMNQSGWEVYEIADAVVPKRPVLGMQAWWKRQVAFKTDQCVPPAMLRTSERQERAGMAADGMIGTVWQTSGRQNGDQWIEIPLAPELAGKEVVIELEGGFDGDLRHASFARAPDVSWVKNGPLTREEIVQVRLIRKEPLVLIEQLRIKVPADVSAVRIGPRATTSEAPNWGVAESRVCLAGR